jgi:hypothetical protein
MVQLDPNGDAVLYGLVHQWLALPSKDDVTNRRSESRQPFRSRQRIAPGHDGEIPPPGAFIDVPCHDLTAAGFSFLLPAPPAFQQLIVAFGNPPDYIYFVAEVTQCTRVLWHASGEVQRLDSKTDPLLSAAAARPMVLVGCRFVQRLE